MMRVNFVKYLCHSIYLREKCRILSNSIVTSHLSENIPKSDSKLKAKKKKYFDESKNDYQDIFGNLDNFEQMFLRIKDDPEDVLEYERAKAAKGKLIIEYINEIKTHLKNHNYEDAVKVLEVDMVNDRKRLNTFTYKMLINYNALKGNLPEAYRLFIGFKKRQGRVTGAIYTSMFNACANCMYSHIALEKANAVLECLRKNTFHKINTSNYNAMLKAYGRHGDLPMCFKIIDEVLETRNKVRSDTYAFLLEACITDKNSGLRHALIVWRKMIQNLVKPDIRCFQLMLKCVNECSLGDVTMVSNIIEDVQKESAVFFKRKVEVRTLPSGEKIRKGLKIPASGDGLIEPIKRGESKTEIIETDVIKIEEIADTQLSLEGGEETSGNLSGENQPNYLQLSESKNELCEFNGNDSKDIAYSGNVEEKERVQNFSISHHNQGDSDGLNLIAFKPTTGSVINFGVITEPHNRISQRRILSFVQGPPLGQNTLIDELIEIRIAQFLLLGGVKGFLKTMSEFGVVPNTKLFTLMLNVIPKDFKAEEELIKVIEDYGVKLDTVFFNSLIKRRFYRFEDSSVKDCLQLMYSLNLKPDIITFGTLALGCRTCELGEDLINTFHNYGYRANREILETLLKNAKRAKDLKYILTILRTAKEDETDLGAKFLSEISSFMRKLLKEKKEQKALEELRSPVPP